jgi:hypothetical protein
METIESPVVSGFEIQLMQHLLAGDHPVLHTLRAQFASARASKRELSGSGFFLTFEVPANQATVSPPDFHIGDVAFEMSGLPHGGEAILFVRNGRIDLLEGFGHDGSWPPEQRDFSITYFGGSRDLDLALYWVLHRPSSS